MSFKKGDKLAVIRGIQGIEGEFKTGDVVYAVADSDGEYTPVSLTRGGDPISREDGITWYTSRFKLVAPAPELDFTKPLETANGTPVTLLTTEGRGKFSVLAYVGESSNLAQYDETGKDYWGGQIHNVAPKPVEVVRYFNLYDGSVSLGHKTRRDANDKSLGGRRGCKKVVFTEGEWDE